MNKGNARILFGLVLLTFCFTASALAQGVIVPIICERRPCMPPPRPIPPRQIVPNALPVKSINIDTKIDGQVATTHRRTGFSQRYALHARRNLFFPDSRNGFDCRIRHLGKRQKARRRSSHARRSAADLR